MNNDAAFIIGKTHDVCQDYARCNTGTFGPRFAVLSDGCSDPRAMDVNIGAMLLTLAAEKVIKFPDFAANGFSIAECVRKANDWRIGMDLSRTCLNATLLTAVPDRENQMVLAQCYGDGVISAIRRDGTTVIFLLEYESNHPEYPVYSLDPSQIDRLKAGFEGNPLTVRHCTITPDGGVLMPTPTKVRLDNTPFATAFPAADYSDVFLMSDGVQRIKRTLLTGVVETMDPIYAIRQLMRPTPNRSGPYCVRALRKFLRESKKDGYEPHDDLSLAAISLD